MTYPTHDEIDKADIEQLCRWSRFLPSPGMNFIGTQGFEQELKDEAEKIVHILTRQKELGGMTPEISKKIGWELRD